MVKEKMKKTIVILIFVANSLIGFSQIVVSIDNQNTLYHRYKNRIKIGTMDGRPFDLKVHNGKIIYDTTFIENENDETVQCVETFLYPGYERKTKVVFVEPDTGLPFDTLEFNVKSLPAPTISLGPLKNGSEAHRGTIRAQTRLFAKYSAEIPLNVSFSILSWEVSITSISKRIVGKGAYLTNEARDLIRQAESGDKITFMTNIKHPNGGIYRRNAEFTVR